MLKTYRDSFQGQLKTKDLNEYNIQVNKHEAAGLHLAGEKLDPLCTFGTFSSLWFTLYCIGWWENTSGHWIKLC